ncbi:MAG: winged helix-turn-helix transcriptional regulator [Candidatus Methanofastidiosia archaeon]
MKEKKKILKLICLKGTVFILEYLDKNEFAHFSDLNDNISDPSLASRLKELLALGLIKHYFERKTIRTEWYELTGKGKRVVQLLQKLQEECEEI